MSDMPTYEVELSIIAASSYNLEEGEIDATADVVLEAVRASTAFIALGAVVSLDLEAESIELFCNVSAESPDDLHAKVARISDVMLEAANGFEYRASATQRLNLVPA